MGKAGHLLKSICDLENGPDVACPPEDEFEDHMINTVEILCAKTGGKIESISLASH